MRGLEDLCDRAFLKTIWKKRLRTKLRTLRLADFHLCHDPLEEAAVELELDRALDDLIERLVAGDFYPAGAAIVRGSKSVGLTRPLALLSSQDLLVYVSIVALVENQLTANSYSWVRHGRRDSSNDDTRSSSESGWFRQWLRRQGQIWTITEDHEWLVESDVANFFASLSIDRLAEHLLHRGEMEEPLVDLFRYMLVHFSPATMYRRSRIGGLPQEDFDASRIVAHTYLHPVDREFETEGDENRYSRWVDDIIIGADSWSEALEQVSRVQSALEALDLHPNSSKTRIYRRAEFEREHMKVENDLIGSFEDDIELHGQLTSGQMLRESVRDHCRLRNRPRGWERVLRRYYTLSKRVGDDYLLGRWPEHLRDYPGSAPQILEYLAAFRLTEARHKLLQAVLADFGGVYQNIDILAREFALLAPNVGNAAVRRQLTEWGWATIDEAQTSSPYLAPPGVLLVTKFGNEADFDRLAALHSASARSDTPVVRQLAVSLFGVGRLSTAQLLEHSHGAGIAGARHARFLMAVERGESAAYQLCRGIVQPVERGNPARVVVRPRGLTLAPLLARADTAEWDRLVRRWVPALQGNPLRLHDAAALRWIREAAAVAPL